MTTTGATDLVAQRAQEYLGFVTAAATTAMIVVGDRLGLYKALAGADAVTATQLAAATDTRERYVREWLAQQAAAGILTHDPAGGTFTLPPEWAAVLADDGMVAACLLPTGMFRDVDPLLDAFRTGAGIPWGEHDPVVFEQTERFWSAQYRRSLVSEWIPALDGVAEKLEAGANVADVGTGHGAPLIMLAQAFPRSRFYGFDTHEPSIEIARARAETGDRLGQVIADDPCDTVLQPIRVGPGYEHTRGWEALARWHDPVLGDVPPHEFVPVAEQLGLIGALGELVLRRACADVAALRHETSAPHPTLHVNVSPSQLRLDGFAELVRKILDDSGLPAGCLHVEITETLFLDPGPEIRAVLDDLHDAGALVCIDDFGTGYASIATLLTLPVDGVKIDRALITDLGVDPSATRRVAAVLGLIRSLGIEHIVAEGVETPEQETELLHLGCPAVQGWRYGHPTPAHPS